MQSFHSGKVEQTDKITATNFEIQRHRLCWPYHLIFRGLNKFGQAFLSRFQVSQTNSPVLENMTIIDTPGILAGDKQRIERGYDFTQIIEWFSNRADLIILLFDSHKLDISNEFKLAINSLRGQEEKIRVILNKSDMVSQQQLMRV